MSYINPRSKLFQHLDRIHAIQAGAIAPPVNVEIDLSNRCSLGCEWCHFAYTHTRGPLAGRGKPEQVVPGGDLMDTDLARSIIDQLADDRVRSITWTGGGEPTLHPSFNHLIEVASGRIHQGLYTNGAHLNPERAALLKSALTWVYVSLDAADRESYRRDKRTDAFERVCEGIRLLAGAEGKATVGVGFLLTSTNWIDLWRMIELGKSCGADYVQFRPTITPGEDTSWMDECLPSLRYITDEPGVEVDLERFEMYQYWKGHKYSTCYWSALQTVITPNGKVWTCVNKREYAGAELGDLSRESFHSIWSRRKIADVNDACRVMCRGHIPNLALNEMLVEQDHGSFV
jgi:GTP 3',8-cyclase